MADLTITADGEGTGDRALSDFLAKMGLMRTVVEHTNESTETPERVRESWLNIGTDIYSFIQRNIERDHDDTSLDEALADVVRNPSKETVLALIDFGIEEGEFIASMVGSIMDTLGDLGVETVTFTEDDDE